MMNIPTFIAKQILSIGRVEWGATDKFNDDEHLEHLKNTLKITRDHFNIADDKTNMHGLYINEGETVLCHTGTSPNSGVHAQALAGAWNYLHSLCLNEQQP